MTVQRLSLEIGAHSSMDTVSPILYWLFSSWALYFLERRTVFCKQRVRETALNANYDSLLVLVANDNALQNALRHVILPLRLCFVPPSGAAMRLDAGDVLADFVDARGLLELAGCLLEAQVELLLLQVGELVLELIGSC